MIHRASAGLAASIAVSVAGTRARALTPVGAVAAVAVGTALITGTSWRGAATLGAFFTSSSALSRVGKPNAVAAKGGRRDASQVLANGGVAALAALSAPLLGQSRATLLAAGALAAAAADTWATELGSLSPSAPRTLLTWRVTAPGTSGAVTPLGLLAAAGGALCVGLAAVPGSASGVARLAVAGVCGALVDSLLGATVQERRWCPACATPTEATRHSCGTATTVVGGIRGINNEVVNACCTLSGALLAGVL